MKFRTSSSDFIILNSEKVNSLRYISLMSFIFIKILDILIELYEITKNVTVSIICRSDVVLQTLNLMYES